MAGATVCPLDRGQSRLIDDMQYKSSDDECQWVTVLVERVLYVHRGRDIIFCTDQEFKDGAELVLKLSLEARQKLLADLR